MQLLANNASALLSGSISAVATTFSVEPARADLFPIGNTTNFGVPLDWFKATIEDVSGNIEIVRVGVRAAASGVMSTVLRGQDGTVARAFAAGSVVELRVTAADIQAAIAGSSATAATIPSTPVGGVSATTVQDAIAELDAEKATPGSIQMQSSNAVTTVGTSTAYVIATLPVQPSLQPKQRYRIQLHTPNGAAPTLVRDGLAAAAFMVYDSTGAKVAPAVGALPPLFDTEYDGTHYVVYNQLPAASSAPTPAVRQTVLSGPVDTNGQSAFGGATGSTTVTVAGTLVMTAANGNTNRVGTKLNPSYAGFTTNGVMYAYSDLNADGTTVEGVGTLAPIYQWGGTPSVVNGQFTFNIQQNIGYIGNGTTAVVSHRVHAGEVTVAGGVVTAIVWYALMGRYRAPPGTTINGAARMSFNHNIGVNLNVIEQHRLLCVSAVAGHVPGDGTDIYAFNVASTGQVAFAACSDRLTISTFAGSVNMNIPHKTTTTRTTIALTDFQYIPSIQRGW